jgi:hypothetical protein
MYESDPSVSFPKVMESASGFFIDVCLIVLNLSIGIFRLLYRQLFLYRQ